MATRTLYCARQTGINSTEFISVYDADDFTFLYDLYGSSGVDSEHRVSGIQENPDNGNIIVFLQKNSFNPGANQVIRIYDSSGAFISQFDLDPIIGVYGSLFVTGTDEIYIIDSAFTPSPFSRIVKLDDSGVELDSWSILPSTALTATNLVIIDTTAYYAVDGPEIKRWDLNTDLALSDLYTIPELRVGCITLTDDENLAVAPGAFFATSGLLYLIDLNGDLVKTITHDINSLAIVKGFHFWTIDFINNFCVSATTCIPSLNVNESTDFLTGEFLVTGPSVVGVCPSRVDDMTISCSVKNITITGVEFPESPTVVLTRNGVPVDFTIVFSTGTQIVLNVPTFANGNFCVLVS